MNQNPPPEVCASCGLALRAEARFCDGCGLALKGSATSAEMRMVTVLFADLKGFTAMSDLLDPDDVRRIVEQTFAITDSGIVAHGGRVEKHMGDGVMAIFGVPQARQDDAERAIRASLRIQSRVRELSQSLVAEGLPRISLRIGINSGRVVHGSVSGAETSILGDTVNVAARLEAICPPGGVLVSDESWRSAGHRFEGQPQEPVKVKGKRAKLRTHLVLAEKRISNFGLPSVVLGRDTSLVGREVEFAALLDAYHRTTPRARSGIVTVAGRPGTGKSRLVEDFVKEVSASRLHLLRARGAPETEKEPFGMLAAAIRSSAAIDPDFDEVELLTQLSRWLRAPSTWRYGNAETILEPPPPAKEIQDESRALAELLGMISVRSTGEDRGRRQLALQAVQRALLEASSDAPLIIDLDDVQWADSSSLEFFEGLVRDHPDHAVLVVATARPQFLERHPDWGSEAEGAETIYLHPLDRESAEAMTLHLLRGVRGLPIAVVREIASRSAGIPYFAEEMVKNLADVGIIQQRAGEWRYSSDDTVVVDTPPSIELLLQTRLDTLGEEQIAVARLAAVLGRAFAAATLLQVGASAAVSKLIRWPQSPEGVTTALDALVSRGIVQHRPAIAHDAYQFVHDLMRDVVYHTLVKRMRRQLHAEIALFLEKDAEERGTARVAASAIARHYTLAERLDDAIDWHQRSARDSRRIGAYHEALEQYDTAFELTVDAGSSAQVKMNLHAWRGSLRSRLGRYDEAEKDLVEAIELAEAADDRAALVRGHNGMSYIGYCRGDADMCLSHAERAAGIAGATDDPELRAESYNTMGIAWGSRGYFERAIDYYSRAAQLNLQLGKLGRLATQWSNIGINHHLLGQLDEAVAVYGKSLEIVREIGNLHGESVALDNLGFTYLAQGDASQARECFADAVEIARRLDTRSLVSEALTGLGRAELLEGNLVEAAKRARASLEIASQAGLKVTMGMALRLMGDVAAAGGPTGPGETPIALYERSIELIRQTGERNELAESLLSLGTHLVGREEDRGGEVVDEAHQLFRDLGMSWRLPAEA